MTFYGYEVILNEIDRGRGHEHRCVYTAGSLISRTLEYVRCLSFVRICLTDLSGVWILCPNFVYLDSVRCLDFVRIFVKKTVRCLSVRILSISILSAVRNFRKKTLSVVCMSDRTRTRHSCPDFRCPCPQTSGIY